MSEYPIKIFLPLLLVVLFIFVYVLQKLYTFACICKSIHGDGIILDESQSYNAGNSSAGNQLTYVEIVCCICALSSRISPRKLLYLPDANRTQYGSTAGDTETISIDSETLPPAGTKQRDVINDTCPVCLELFTDNHVIAVLQCKHGFHSTCIAKWLSSCPLSSCPMCKKPVSTEILYIDESLATLQTQSLYRIPMYGGGGISIPNYMI